MKRHSEGDTVSFGQLGRKPLPGLETPSAPPPRAPVRRSVRAVDTSVREVDTLDPLGCLHPDVGGRGRALDGTSSDPRWTILGGPCTASRSLRTGRGARRPAPIHAHSSPRCSPRRRPTPPYLASRFNPLPQLWLRGARLLRLCPRNLLLSPETLVLTALAVGGPVVVGALPDAVIGSRSAGPRARSAASRSRRAGRWANRLSGTRCRVVHNFHYNDPPAAGAVSTSLFSLARKDV